MTDAVCTRSVPLKEAERDRLAKAGSEGQVEGVAQARELFQEAKRKTDTFAGVYLMPSFGRYENCLEVLKT